jgi:hypothetical protein
LYIKKPPCVRFVCATSEGLVQAASTIFNN